MNPRAIEPHRALTMHLTVTKTGFDMDPFVVTSLGRKVCRTRVIRHNLNPVYNEKIVLQVMRHEQAYTINFSVVDRDKLSGNDFVASTTLFTLGAKRVGSLTP